jgi:hypothetical protein
MIIIVVCSILIFGCLILGGLISDAIICHENNLRLNHIAEVKGLVKLGRWLGM